jgi:hypothetical protein
MKEVRTEGFRENLILEEFNFGPYLPYASRTLHETQTELINTVRKRLTAQKTDVYCNTYITLRYTTCTRIFLHLHL